MEKIIEIEIYQPKAHSKAHFYFVFKRALDVCLSVLGGLFFVPLFLIVAIAIKCEDPKGSVFFQQTRVGKGGKTFQMYKFRSMVANAEKLLTQLQDKNEISGAMFKIKDDPRITKVGKWLRKTSIDELPQLLNVIKGDMSLVGPRPPLVNEVEAYSSYHKQRLTVVPGCTGLWQVSGRNSIGFEEMVELDLKYIKKRSILFDFTIMFKTFFVLFGSKDAF